MESKSCYVELQEVSARWRIPCLQKFRTQQYQMNVLGKDVCAGEDLILTLVISKSMIIFFRGIQTLTTFCSLSEEAIGRRFSSA